MGYSFSKDRTEGYIKPNFQGVQLDPPKVFPTLVLSTGHNIFSSCSIINNTHFYTN